MTLKKDPNFEEKLTFYLKNGKSKNLHFDGFCRRKYAMFELKRYREVVLWKMTYGFKNDIIWWIYTQVVESNVRSTVYNVLAEGMYFLDKSP